MEFQKEFDELLQVIEEVKKSINLPEEGEPVDFTIEDMEELLNRTQGFIDRLNEKANSIAGKLGMSREELNKYVENPQNFKQEDWKAIEQMQTQVDRFQKTLMQSLFNQKNELIVKKEREKQRKPKSGTKRDWMPM